MAKGKLQDSYEFALGGDQEGNLVEPAPVARRKIHFDISPRQRTDSTLADYRRLERHVAKLTAAEEGMAVERVGVSEMVEWLAQHRRDYRADYWRRLRTACRQTWLADQPQDFDRGIALLKDVDTEGTRRRRDDGEPFKAKHIKRTDLALLLDWLSARQRGTFYGEFTANLLIATLHVGLRPNEWVRSWIEEDRELGDLDMRALNMGAVAPNPDCLPGQILLAVDTLKTTNGHGAPHIRRMDITKFNETAIKRIRAMILIARDIELGRPGHFAQTINGSQKLLVRANEVLWPRRRQKICITTLRHQFLANAKTVMSHKEVAALAGHASTRTATRSYGRRQYGWTDGGSSDGDGRGGGGGPEMAVSSIITLPIPDPSIVAAVRHYDDASGFRKPGANEAGAIVEKRTRPVRAAL